MIIEYIPHLNCTEITSLCDNRTKVSRIKIQGKWTQYINSNINNLKKNKKVSLQEKNLSINQNL